MQEIEIYYVSENTYEKLYDFCANKLMAAEMKNSEGPFVDTWYFKRAASQFNSSEYLELQRLFDSENVPTDAIETIDNCPDELLSKVVRETLMKFAVGRGENVKPGTQFVSAETYYYILADIAETLLFELLSKRDLQGIGNAEYDFYEWFNKRINTNSSNISEMIVRDGASPRLIVNLGNRAENFGEVIDEILNTFRVKPF